MEKKTKEFCSGCGSFYTITDGKWEPCPSCDGAGNPLACSCSCSCEGKKEKTEETYIPIRERWDLTSR